MPTYEYECTKCHEVFELFQSITARAKRTLDVECKECNNRAPVCRRIGTGAGILFRGDGFYGTDYRSEEYKKAAKAEQVSSKPAETAGAAKPDVDGAAKAPVDKPAKKSGTEVVKKAAKPKAGHKE